VAEPPPMAMGWLRPPLRIGWGWTNYPLWPWGWFGHPLRQTQKKFSFFFFFWLRGPIQSHWVALATLDRLKPPLGSTGVASLRHTICFFEQSECKSKVSGSFCYSFRCHFRGLFGVYEKAIGTCSSYCL
jgi:hypothetical protein